MGRGNRFNTGSNLCTTQPTCGGNAKSGLPNTLGMTNANKAEKARLAVTDDSKPGQACTGAIFTTKLNQVNAGGVGKIVLSRAYVTHSNTGDYM